MPLRSLSVLTLLLLLLAASPTQDAAGVTSSSQSDGLGVVPGQEFVLRLSAHDDLRAGVDFEAASYGVDLEGAQLGLDRAELVYGLLQENRLSFGFRDKEQARVVDLGDFRVPATALVRDSAPRPPASVMHTLQLESRKVTYRAPVDKRLNLREAASITAILPESGVAHVQPQLGHVYLLRYRGVPEVSDAWGRLVAFEVVELQPAQSVTLRCRILPGSP
ncbi:MAG: hypothetical protein DRQ55_00585 [Planctomycetota bacterium]|nr:MAG: hypothetical protein DRQ55_00585 [Planctomycetota bacterium]